MCDYDDILLLTMLLFFQVFHSNNIHFFSITSYLGVYANKLAFGLN